MYKIATLNKISPVGLAHLTDDYQITENLAEATGVLVRSQAMHEMEFEKTLLGIARAGAGVNNIPLDRCADEGIVVFNTPGANANAVKELVIGSLFLAARNLPAAMTWAATLKEDVLKAVEKGKGQFAGTEIQGKTLGVVGLGAIGAMVANAAKGLGMNVIGYDAFFNTKSALSLCPGVKVVESLDKLLPEADYISIHVPAMDATKGMFNAEIFGQMKEGAVLLNFSRDKLVKDADLLAALESGKVSQYVTDFATDELLNKPGVVAIPHLGASTEEAEDNCATMAVWELRDYIENGNIVNSVNYPAVNLGPLNGDNRVCVLTKGVEVSDVVAALKGINAKAMASAKKGDYGYVLISTSDAITSIPAIDGAVKVRVIQD